MSALARPRAFWSRIYKVGVNRCVDVPAGACGNLRGGKYPDVRGTAGGIPLRSTLVPGRGGKFRLFLHSRLWKKLGVDAGAVIEVYLECDPEPRQVAPPKELLAALAVRRGALAAFHKASEALRRGFATWVLAAKTAETRERRIRLGISRLMERARRKQQERRPRPASSKKGPANKE